MNISQKILCHNDTEFPFFYDILIPEENPRGILLVLPEPHNVSFNSPSFIDEILKNGYCAAVMIPQKTGLELIDHIEACRTLIDIIRQKYKFLPIIALGTDLASISARALGECEMDRISGFAFDLMIVAGVTAIRIDDIKNYILPIIIVTIVGALVTYIYIRKVAKECFKGFEHEFFLMSFGTMTGTASNGMIMMKEIDPGLKTPTSSLYILSNFPAMVMIAPLLFTLGFASKSLGNALIAFGIYLCLWIVYSIFLFRRRIFKKKYANSPVEEWKEEE
jgi:hypothetical protein